MNNTGFAQDIKFGLPLKGTEGKDFYIDYYVDHDSTKGIIDAVCGTKTYNGHTGTDFLLKSFKTMDSGVYVYAAADGVVLYTHDGFFDRSKHWVSGGLGNCIAILHANGYRTYYGHLMKHSLLVKEGDSIKAGQPIAKVGSSGYSCYPHVHFEVKNSSGAIIDPFVGNCETRRTSLWISQPLYDTGLYVIDNGFVPYIPNEDTLQERYLVTDTFYTNKDTTICFWVQMHGLHKGDHIRAAWYDPANFLQFSYSFIWESNWWYTYSWPYIKMPEIKGKWTAQFYVNDRLLSYRKFYVMKRKKEHHAFGG